MLTQRVSVFFFCASVAAAARGCSSGDGDQAGGENQNLGPGVDGGGSADSTAGSDGIAGSHDGAAGDEQGTDDGGDDGGKNGCPAQEPAEAYACGYYAGPFPPRDGCQYGSVTCTCFGMPQNSALWHCESADGEPGCPAREPSSGVSCYPSRLAGKTQCTYGATTCTCQGAPDEAALWQCAAAP
jgi:hypothetical protein